MTTFLNLKSQTDHHSDGLESDVFMDSVYSADVEDLYSESSDFETSDSSNTKRGIP